MAAREALHELQLRGREEKMSELAFKDAFAAVLGEYEAPGGDVGNRDATLRCRYRGKAFKGAIDETQASDAWAELETLRSQAAEGEMGTEDFGKRFTALASGFRAGESAGAGDDLDCQLRVTIPCGTFRLPRVPPRDREEAAAVRAAIQADPEAAAWLLPEGVAEGSRRIRAMRTGRSQTGCGYLCSQCDPAPSFPTLEELVGHCSVDAHDGVLRCGDVGRASPPDLAAEKAEKFAKLRHSRGKAHPLVQRARVKSPGSLCPACESPWPPGAGGLLQYGPDDACLLADALRPCCQGYEECLGPEHIRTLAIAAFLGHILTQCPRAMRNLKECLSCARHS